MELSQTPPNDRFLAYIFSTHTSSKADLLTNAKIEDIKPYVEQDLNFFLTCGINDLQRHLFDYTNEDLELDGNSIAKRVTEETVVLRKPNMDLIETMKERKTYEKSMHYPFSLLANNTLENASRDSSNTVFCRRDPKIISGERNSTRSPDVACLSSQHPLVKDGKRKKHRIELPDRLKWDDVLHVFEFKRDVNLEDAEGKTLKPPQAGQKIFEPSTFGCVSTTVSQASESLFPVLEWNRNLGKLRNPRKRRKNDSAVRESTKRKKTNDGKSSIRPDYVKQTRSCQYAIDIMSMVEKRRHVISAPVAGVHIWICYYDRSGIVYTDSIPLSNGDGFYKFLVLLMGLDNLDDASRELSTHLQGPFSGEDEDSISWALRISGQSLLLSGTLQWRKPYGLLGRGNRVFKATQRSSSDAKVYSVKSNWLAKSRMSEAVTMSTAKERLRKLPGDINFRSDHQVGDELLDHLPTLYWHTDILGTSTGVRKFMDGYEARINRVIVFDILFPVYELTDVPHLMQVHRDHDIFKVMHLLWSENVCHRDISIGNITYRKDANGNFKCGILNDWDLSGIDGKDKESLFRTGTMAFLARDFLKGEETAYFERHDLESVFFALVWNVTRYENGVAMDTDALIGWADVNDEFSCDSKNSYITVADKRPKLGTTFSKLYWHWIYPLASVFFRGVTAKHDNQREVMLGKPPIDEETLGGNIIYEKIWAILKEDLPESLL